MHHFLLVHQVYGYNLRCGKGFRGVNTLQDIVYSCQMKALEHAMCVYALINRVLITNRLGAPWQSSDGLSVWGVHSPTMSLSVSGSCLKSFLKSSLRCLYVGLSTCSSTRKTTEKNIKMHPKLSHSPPHAQSQVVVCFSETSA